VTTSTPATARWTITGSHSVALQFSANDRILLTVYSGMDYFTGCRDDGKLIVTGRIIPPLETSSIKPAEPTPRAATVPPAQAPASHAAAGNEEMKKAVLSDPWTWNYTGPESRQWNKIVFWSDGTLTFSKEGTLTTTPANARWTIASSHSVAVQFGASDRILLIFNSSMDYFTGCRDDGRVIVSGRKITSRDAPISPQVAVPAVAPSSHVVLPKPAARQSFGSYQEEALLGHAWSWDTVRENGSHPVIRFFQDGRVSAGWHWQWLPKSNGELVVDCFWGPTQHLYLKFDRQFSEFEAYGEQGGCQVRGKRLAPVGQGGENR